MARTSATSPGSASGGGSVTSVTATDTTIVVAGTATDPTVGAGVIVAPATHAATSKATPVDADEIPLVDTAASNVLKRLTWANVKATLKTYFDTLYPSGSGTSSGTNTGDQTVPAFATPAVVLGSAAAAGAASTVIRSDGTIAAFDATAPSTQAFSDAAAVGTAAFAARRDHKHAMPADPFTGATAGGNLTGTFPNPTIASGVVTGTMLVDGTVANADLANMAAKTVKMRHTNSTGVPEDTSMANLWTDLSANAGASVSMNSQKLTSLAAGTTAGDSVRYEQLVAAPVVITGTGTWTVSTSGQQIFAALVVGGGGGGGKGGAATGGSGGGGGQVLSFFYLGVVSSNQTVTIGAGGTGSTGANATAGGTTSIGTLAVAAGGAAGIDSSNVNVPSGNGPATNMAPGGGGAGAATSTAGFSVVGGVNGYGSGGGGGGGPTSAAGGAAGARTGTNAYAGGTGAALGGGGGASGSAVGNNGAAGVGGAGAIGGANTGNAGGGGGSGTTGGNGGNGGTGYVIIYQIA